MTKARSLALGIVATGLAACATGGGVRQLLPGVVVTREATTYQVEGETVDALVESIRERGPRIDGRGFGARTTWNVRWRYGYGSLGECRITRLDIDLQISSVMPEWDPPETAPAELVAEWDRFLAALERHESVHETHAIEAARRVRDTLRDVRGTSCDELERQANAAAREVVAHYHQRDIDHDRETDHGRTEGVELGSPAESGVDIDP